MVAFGGPSFHSSLPCRCIPGLVRSIQLNKLIELPLTPPPVIPLTNQFFQLHSFFPSFFLLRSLSLAEPCCRSSHNPPKKEQQKGRKFMNCAAAVFHSFRNSLSPRSLFFAEHCGCSRH